MSIAYFGTPEDKVFDQLQRCVDASGPNAKGVLCADNHFGYSMPIGGVVASQTVVMPAGVGYDIGCGNCAVRTNGKAVDLKANLPRFMDDLFKTISFGVGRANNEKVDDKVFESINKSPVLMQRKMIDIAREQLGTVGSGNHYVDLFEDAADGQLWIGVHFGSRGFGHKTAAGFLALAAGKNWSDHVNESMDAPPTVIPINSPLGQDYLAAMNIAGEYAYAGRNWVVNKILAMLQVRDTMRIHNHHNFAWFEQHYGERWLVTRKGATPAFPGQRGFIGGSMATNAVIVEGVESENSPAALYSTVHGAGRVMSRTEAAGKFKKGVQVKPGKVDWPMVYKAMQVAGIELRGGGADEAPECYKNLDDVLKAHGSTIKILHTLKPIGVAMAGKDVRDPYKD